MPLFPAIKQFWVPWVNSFCFLPKPSKIKLTSNLEVCADSIVDFQVASSARNFTVELAHMIRHHRAKTGKHFLLPRIVFKWHFRLNFAKFDRNWPSLEEGLGSVKSLAPFSHVNQHRLPHSHVRTHRCVNGTIARFQITPKSELQITLSLWL